MRMHKALELAVGLVAVGLVGCGGSGSGGGTGGAGGGGNVDACAIVTADDAALVFEVPASRDTGAPVTDPNMLGECLWEWHNADNDSRLLQFRVWGKESYYSEPSGSMPLALGDKGFIRVNAIAGVDLGWVQDARFWTLAYSTVGSSVPSADTRVDQLKALAQKVSAQVASP